MAYGKAFEKYPVETGDVWKVGPHIFGCGDVTTITNLSELFEFVDQPYADVLYTDPPWNIAIQKRFHKFAGIDPPVDFLGLLGNMVRVYKKYCPVGPVWLEMGRTHAVEFRDLLLSEGAEFLIEFETTYGSRKKPSYATMFCVTFGPDFVSASAPSKLLHENEVLR